MYVINKNRSSAERICDLSSGGVTSVTGSKAKNFGWDKLLNQYEDCTVFSPERPKDSHLKENSRKFVFVDEKVNVPPNGSDS